MTEKRIQFSNIVQNQLPAYVREEFPLVAEFLSQYYLSQEVESASVDLIQNIDQYVKIDNITNLTDSAVLLSDISFTDSTIEVDLNKTPDGISGFPDSYGLLKIDNEIITYTGKTANSFTGCIRGFSGTTSYNDTSNGGQLVFSETVSEEHTAGIATITNLSSLFLKEFLLKAKYQLTPGFQDRTLFSNINQALFIKQAKDFYSSKGTDESFEILFRALYGEDVQIIKPKEYLFRPSDAHYRITNDLVVESISGDPSNLAQSTLFQDEYDNITKGYAPISSVERILSKDEKYFYKLKIDAGYNKDIEYEGSTYGNFLVHSKTKIIGQVVSGSTTIDVDSTVGFPLSGSLYVKYNDDTEGVISYTSKNIDQFLGCSNISGIILDKSDISIDTYAYGESFGNPSETIKVRINSVISGLELPEETYFYSSGDTAKIKTLGIKATDVISNNWIFNVATSYEVVSLKLIDSSDRTYSLTLKHDHIFRIGDSIKIADVGGIEKNSTVIDVTSSKTIVVKGQGELSLLNTYKITKNLLKANSLNYPSANNLNANVQNVYKIKEKTLIASPSIPCYGNEILNVSSNEITFSGTFPPVGIGSTNIFNITSTVDHGFYTGDSVYYTPQKGSTTSSDSDNNPINSEVVVSSIFDEGLYFIKRIDPNNVKFSRSRSDIFNSRFISVESAVTINENKIILYKFANKTLESQKLLREISLPVSDGNTYPTTPGLTGILVNGTEILNYKSSDVVYYGELEEIDVISGGNGYDIINPPNVIIEDSVGTGATGYCSVSGSLQEIRILDPGFDYVEIPTIKITGGNGSGAVSEANMKLIDHRVSFNSEVNSNLVGLGSTQSTIGFSTYHKFRNAEQVIYKTNGQKSVGGLSTDSSYFVSVQNSYTIKLHNTISDVISGINTINLSSYGIGNHIFESYNKKSIVASINIINSGSGYENKKRTVGSIGISTSSNSIEIYNHGFNSGDIVKYSTEGTVIGGLTNNTNYYVTKIDNDKFILSNVGGENNIDFYYRTAQYINLTSFGVGTHIFNYPEISVEVIGNVGISSISGNSFKCQVQPIFRGSITSIYLSNKGVGYGSSDIINYIRKPNITLSTGSDAQLTPIINNGQISEVLVNNAGKNYKSPPDLQIIGDGFGAVLVPVISNGQLISIKVLEGGIGYTQKNTTVLASTSGLGVVFDPRIQTWRVNLFQKNIKNITSDDGFITNGISSKYGLQYANLYAPRKLREILYATDQSGKILYGKKDLKRVDNSEVSSTDHSPIIGWSYGGNPIYGPYGYITKKGGTISQMKSGYKLDLKANRPSLSEFPEGFFIEDYTYKKVNDETFLDENNGRFCVTPEFPNGIYAYFATFNLSADSSGNFSGYKRPVFPYLIGENYYSNPIKFNFDGSSNQDEIDLNQTDWARNTNQYNLMTSGASYAYIDLPNNLDQTIDVKSVIPGSISNIAISTGGVDYKVNDQLVFDNLDVNNNSRGFGASAKVSRIGGKSINSVSVATSTIYNVEFYTSENKGTYIAFTENPHNFINLDTITIAGLNTTSSLLEGSYNIGVSANTLSLVGVGSTTVGINSTSVTGIVTYISVAGNLSYPYIRENDILKIESEKVKVLSIDQKASRIRILREIDGTVGTSHSVTTILYENPRKLTINAEFNSDYSYLINREIYFNPIDSVGLGTTSGVGIGTTIIFSNPGVGATSIFIPTKTIYIPNHNLNTGDELIYSTYGGSAIGVSTDGKSTSLTLSNQSTVYAAKVSNDLIGISTVKVGLGTTGTFVGIASTTNSSSTLYFIGIGTGTYHSFKTNYSVLSGEISNNLVTVSTANTHGLQNNDTVYIDINPSISTTFTIKYNDYNRRLLINPKDFVSSGVNTTSNEIVIQNHGFVSGQKVIHTSITPSQGLFNNEIYYIVKLDNNTVKLSDSYYGSTSLNPSIIGIGSTGNGTLSLVNPPITVYRDSSVIFDLSDSSLSYTNQSSSYPAFQFNIYTDSTFSQLFETTGETNIFNIQKSGTIGVSSDAKVTLNINEYTPEKLYYNLVPVFESALPLQKEEIISDSLVLSNNEIQIKNSLYNGKQSIKVASASEFTYNLNTVPEKSSYSNSSILYYETDSLTAFGPISKIDITNKGSNYYSLPRISNVISNNGKNAILDAISTSIGKIKKSKINDIGFNFASDLTLRPNISLPQIVKIDPLSSFESIGITSYGRGYSSTPKLLVFDGKTNQLITDVDLKYNTGDTQVTILKNTFGINKIPPTILPIQNSNGVGISSVGFNTTTKNVTVNLSVGFSTANSFPFEVNDRVLIENISVGIGSTAKGYNSSNYNYQLFTLTAVDENLGGIGSVTYSLNGYLTGSEFPGTFDAVNSSGRIIPEKYFPIFNPVLKTNNYIVREDVESNDASGYVQSWDPITKYLKIISKDDFKRNDIIRGLSSKTQGIASSITTFNSFASLDAKSKVENGWQNSAGFLNDNIQRIQDNLYYQNFSYSIKSEVDYDTWNDAVSTLNHTVGYKKFSDYQLNSSLYYNISLVESNSNKDSLTIKVPQDLPSFEVVNDIISYVDLNCVYDFDLVKENSIQIDSQIYSDEIIFKNRVLTDYSESIGNRVLSIDDISPQFNSNPRSVKYSEVSRFLLSDARAKKYITLVTDKTYVSQRQLLNLTLIHDNNFIGYINQYGRIETTYDMGSFDFTIEGLEGVLLFYPTNYSVNDYDITTLSYNLNDGLLGISSSNLVGIVNINTNSVFVGIGSTTTIVGAAVTNSSHKILVEIAGSNGEYEFDELNVVHNGTTVKHLEYGQLTTDTNNYSNSGLGTYHSYISGSNLKIDFIPNIGIGSAIINTISVSFANTSITGSGIGTFDMKHSKIEARSTSIASSPTPTANVIGDYIDNYDAAYFIVQVGDATNNRYQLSEFIIVDDYNDKNPASEIYYTEYANIETSVGLGTIGAQRSGNITQVTFTPLPNIGVEVKVYMNALRQEDDAKDIISFNNAAIETSYGEYTSSDSDVKRAFSIKHQNNDVFERYFDGSSSNIVDISKDTITIPNHFFVSGENIKYTNTGAGSTQAIGIASTSFAGIGITDKMPLSIYAVKIDENKIKLASSAEDALKSIPKVLDLTNVGIGSLHKFVSTNQNAKVVVAIDNVIQSPVVSTAVTTTLSNIVYTTDNLIYFSGITSFFGGDLIRIDDEIMRIEGIGIGSTNAIRVRRPWLGTVLSGYSTGDLVTKVIGNYNIVDNTLNFVDAPYGNIALVTDSPDNTDWSGISASSSFQGRVFLRSGTANTTDETYNKNYIFDDISSKFNGIENKFALKSQGSNITDISTKNAIILVNDIFQGPGLSYDYTLQESVGITSISFTGTATSPLYDINTSNLPSGGIIVSVGSSEGFGYQPLVSAGGTAIVSISGTISSISIGNSGSGYRAANTYQVVTNTSTVTGIGSTVFAIDNTNSVFKVLEFTNTGSNCKVSIGTYISNANIISVGATTINIGTGSTSTRQIPSKSKVIISIANPPIGYVNVGVGTSGINTSGISTITHIGIATIKNGYIVSPISITNPGTGYTSTNPPFVIFDDPLSYSNIPLIYSSPSSGIGTQAMVDIVVGQGSSVIDFEITNTGYSYGEGDVLTVPTGGTTGIPTTSGFNNNKFEITIQKTFSDKFTGWSIGELQVFDNIEDLFDGETIAFPLTVANNPTSIRSSKGSNIVVQDTLLIFVNDILQVPGSGYIFDGGSLITFTEAPKVGDTCKILFYRGSGSIDVIDRNVLETVKIGDELTIGYDSSLSQQPSLQEDTRTVTLIKPNVTNLIETNPYFGPGNTNDENLLRPVIWRRQTEDKIINEKEIGKDRMLYEPIINPVAYLIQSVGIGSTVIYVDNLRPFFNAENENDTSLDFQKNITFISQDNKVSAAATAVVSVAGTISSIIISDGGGGYVLSPSVTIQSPVGLGTTQKANASSSITAGIVTSISITGPGTGYTIPPVVLIEPPSIGTENSEVRTYEGDFGIIVGISTTSVGVASTGLIFDFLIPRNSFLRNSSITGVTGVTTISGIQTGYYFAINNSNIGYGVTSLNASGQVVGVGTTFLDGIYQVASVSIAQTSAPGVGVTYVAKVTTSISNYNGLLGIGYSSFFGDYSWGKITLSSRNEEISYNSYTNSGYSGISSGTIVKRTSPLKYSKYKYT